MRIIGLTGGIASGKSTIVRALQALGAIIIDADQVAHTIMEPGKPAWKEIVARFGSDIVNDDETINRTKLGQIVFNNSLYLQELNLITHPRVAEALKNELYQIKSLHPDAIVVVEIALLYEANFKRFCDEVWVVWIDRDTQINRLMHRDGLNREDALKRIEAQMPLDEKAKRADLVIDNRGSYMETLAIATKYFNEILTKK